MTGDKPDKQKLLVPDCPAEETGPSDSGFIVKILKNLIIWSNLVVAVLVTCTAAMRYLFKMDLYGVDELILLAAFILYFSGSAYGAHRGSHICADILSNYLKAPKVKTIVTSFTAFLTFTLSVIFSWLGVKMFTWQWMTQGKTQIWKIPLWVPQGFIAICLVLMSIYFFIWFIRRVKDCRTVYKGEVIFQSGETGKE